MSYDHWKTTEPQDGLRQCPSCGKLTDCLYPMVQFHNGDWREVEGPMYEWVPDSQRFCYQCCNELEGGERG